MDVIEYNILNKKKYFKKRRNLIRRFLLLLFVVSFFCLVNKTYSLPKKKELTVYVKQSFFISHDYVRDYVVNQALSRNFFLLSTRDIGSSLIQSAPILKKVFIRKYLFPALKLDVYLQEKNIWGKLLFRVAKYKNRSLYLTDEADVLSTKYLNLENIPSDLIELQIHGEKLPSKKTILIIKKNYEDFQKIISLPLKFLVLTGDDDLEVYSNFGFKIKCGKADDFLQERISKLSNIADILDGIKSGKYKSGYLDLTLENDVLFKPEPGPNTEQRTGIFQFLKKQ